MIKFTDTQILKAIYGFIALTLSVSCIGGVFMGFYSVFTHGKSVYALGCIVVIVICVSCFFLLILGILWRKSKDDAGRFAMDRTRDVVQTVWEVIQEEDTIYKNDYEKSSSSETHRDLAIVEIIEQGSATVDTISADSISF